jgi:hypothetical protein
LRESAPWRKTPLQASTKMLSKKRPQRFAGGYILNRCDESMALILDDKQPIILVPDNSPIAALSAIGNLDWLLVPGVPVKITDQVATEATRNQALPWAAETCSWIVAQVVRGRVEIVYTDTGFDHRQQFDAWVAGGMDPTGAPRSRNLGEASILELMTALENEARDDKKAIVLVDERRARKALSTLDANLDIVSTRAFFKVLTTDYGLNDTSGYWHLVLRVIEDMDPLDEVLKIRVEGGASEKQRKR